MLLMTLCLIGACFLSSDIKEEFLAILCVIQQGFQPKAKQRCFLQRQGRKDQGSVSL